MQSQFDSYSAMKWATRQSSPSSLLSDAGSDEQGWDTNCLLPGIRAVLEAIEKCGEAGERQSD